MKTRKAIRKAKSFSTNKVLSGKVNHLIKGTRLDPHPYQKTEQIEVIAKMEVKSEISEVPSGSRKDLIFLQCENCQSSGYHQIDAAYRMVDVSKLTDAETQTEPLIETATVSHDVDSVEIVKVGSFPGFNSVPSSAGRSPIVILSDSEENVDNSSGSEEVLSNNEEEEQSSTDEELSDSSDEEQSVPKHSQLQKSSKHTPSPRQSTRTQPPSKQSHTSLYSTQNIGSSKHITPLFDQKAGYKCILHNCVVSKRSVQDLFEHVKTDHTDTPHRCDLCPSAFEFQYQLDRHKTHSGEQSIREEPNNTQRNSMEFEDLGQEICEKFKSGKWFVKTSDHQSRMMNCRVCNERLCKDEMDKHIKTLHPKKYFPCSLCPSICTSRFSLDKHKLKHRSGSSKSHECGICSKTFSDRNHLARHQIVHTGERHFKCEFCGTLFTTQHAKNRHVRRAHTGEKPFACTHCGKRFAASHKRLAHEDSCN
eukprot:sb/3464318/